MKPEPRRLFPGQACTSLALRVLLLAAAVSLVVGCGPEEPPARPNLEPMEKKPAREMPDIPGADGEKTGEADVLVKDTTVLAKYQKPFYEQQTTLPSGAVRGFCFIRWTRGVALPPSPPINLKEGPDAIRDPQPGEIRYYEQARLRAPRTLGTSNPARRVGVIGAAIIFRGVKAGRRPPLRRAIFSVANGALRGNYAEHSGHFFGIQVGPVKDRVAFKNFDKFPCHIAFSRLGSSKIRYEAELPGDKVQFRGHVFHRRIKPIHSPPVREMGIYVAQGRRHPWMKAWLVVTNNPYVAVSQGVYRTDGLFHMGGVPVGKWKVEVWHPVYEPVKRIHDIEIVENETAELGIEFKMPPSRPVTSKKTE